MDVQAEINWIKKELTHVKDVKLIEAFKNLLQYRKRVSENLEERISIEQYNKELEASEKEIESGNFYTHEEVLNRIGQWGRK